MLKTEFLELEFSKTDTIVVITTINEKKRVFFGKIANETDSGILLKNENNEIFLLFEDMKGAYKQHRRGQ